MRKCHCYFFLVFSQMMDHPSILAVIPSDFSSPYHVYPEVFVYQRLQELFFVQLFTFVSLSLLRSTKSCSRVSYSVGSAPPSPDNFFSLLFSAKKFFKRLITLSLTALAVKRNPSTAFKVVSTFCHEVSRSRLPDLL